MNITQKSRDYFEEYGAEFESATEDQLASLKERNANGDTIDYFSSLNISAEIPVRSLIRFDDAQANLEQMVDMCPNCEVWQHGFIAFARDIEGRVYCFNQNDRSESGVSKIVRHPYPVGDDCTLDQAISTAEPISDSFEAFIDWIMADPEIDAE
ncbi:MAG: hypothetical protein L3J01_04165 [Thiomicrorhabdus sp.]|nr:hypothetical protein [Thiomicrorhabdus sp.]